MDEFPIFYIRNKDKEKNNKSIKKDKYKDKNEPKKKLSLKAFKHSNSDSDFIIIIEKEKRNNVLHYLHKKNKLQSKDSNLKYSPNKKGYNVKKIIKKNKNQLSNYIENNSQKVKLFGNSRYNQNSPFLFVEDYKNNLPEKKMGLVPLPSKKKREIDLYKEPRNLYDMQRNISMVRRYQYEKKNEKKKLWQKNNKNSSKDSEYFNMIQSWWKSIPKIIDIQRVFRGYSIRKQTSPILKLYRFMKNFERLLSHIILRDYLIKIKEYSVLRRRKIIKGSYISKKREFISTKFKRNITMIENNFRCYRAKTKRNFLQRGKNGRIINHNSFITKKIYIRQNEFNNNILKLQNNIKKYVHNKNYYERNLIHKNKGIYYSDKVYLNKNNKKIIDFMKLMTHTLQLLGLKKKIYYKYPNEYDIDDINKIKFIQKNYLKHYYNKVKKISFYNTKNICFIHKIRKESINEEIKLIQRQLKNYLNDKTKFKKNIIKNKPISGNLFNKKKPNNLQENINNSSYISKENIRNVYNELIFVQKIIHKFIEKKKEKRKGRKSKINKIDFHNNFLFTKEYSNQKNCIKKLSNFQRFYKARYNIIKENIINPNNEYSVNYDSFEDLTKPKIIPLRQLLLKNKIPKTINFSLYISKKRLIRINNRYNINFNKNSLSHRVEGLTITKVRYINNENKIKAIQKTFKKHNKFFNDIFAIQKPPTDNKNFYTFSSDSYDDIIYSKKLNNYFYLSKIIKINIIEKVKKIQNCFLNHLKTKNTETKFLDDCKNLLYKKKHEGLFSFYSSKNRIGPSIIKNIFRNKKEDKNYSIPIQNLFYISKIRFLNNEKDILYIQRNLRNKINKNNKIISSKLLFKKIEKKIINGGRGKNNFEIKDNSFSLGLNITKKYKRIIYKKEKIKRSLITKITKNPENMTQINVKFLLLTFLFITKNIQQYIFSLLKNNYNSFEYPFYLETLNRVLKYLQSNGYKGRNVKFLFSKVFSDYNSNNTIKKDLILLLTKEKEDNLRNTNIYNNLDEDFFEYIYQFSKFDKRLKNEKFLNVRLNNTIFHNTNIFTITKFIDNEFDNFINGKYCYKCYLDLNLCKCFKSNEELTDEALDIGLNDDYNPKNSIKFFEYDNNKKRGALIEGKPKIDNKDNIITKNHFTNQLKNSKLNPGNNSKNNLFHSKKNVEFLRYYDEKKQNKDKINISNNDYNNKYKRY